MEVVVVASSVVAFVFVFIVVVVGEGEVKLSIPVSGDEIVAWNEFGADFEATTGESEARDEDSVAMDGETEIRVQGRRL